MHLTLRPSFAPALDTTIHWVEAGQGRPLILLHGLGDSHRTWHRIAPRLARTRRVLMPDLPGHGLSARPDASYALAWNARVIGAWIAALGLDEVDIAGHSYGGGVAQTLLVEARDRVRVRRLALLASGGLGREVSLGLRLAALPRVVERTGQPFMALGTRLAMRAGVWGLRPETRGRGADSPARGDDALDAAEVEELAWMNARPGTARAFARTVADVIHWRAGQRRHLLDRAHEITGELPPVALIWGERDPIVPCAHGDAACQILEGATLVRLPGSGHFPHLDRAAIVADALDAFLDAPALPPARVRRPTTISLAVARPERRRGGFIRALGALGRRVWRWLAGERA